MSRLGQLQNADPEKVRIGDCRCEGTPHDGQDGRDDGDWVGLPKRIGYQGGVDAHQVITRHRGDSDAIERGLLVVYVRQISWWNFLEDDGSPTPVTPENIELFMRDFEAARHVADKGDELYSDEVLAPLRTAVAKLSRPGPTATSTSAKTKSGARRRKQ